MKKNQRVKLVLPLILVISDVCFLCGQTKSEIDVPLSDAIHMFKADLKA